MSNHPVHETLPEGFNFVDRLQLEAFMATGSIPGASKVALVAGAGELPRLACRLRPPRDRGVKYIADYRAGWSEAVRDLGVANGSEAYYHGYRDRAERRMKWHLAHCSDHGDHDGGCHA